MSLPKTLPAVTTVVLALLALPAAAATVQSVSVELRDLQGNTIGVSSDSETVPDGQLPSRTVLAAIAGPNYDARAQMDRSGALSISGALFDAGEMIVNVSAQTDEFTAPSGAFIGSRLLIDGGILNLLGPEAALVELDVQITSSLLDDPIGFLVRLDSPANFALADLTVETNPGGTLPFNLPGDWGREVLQVDIPDPRIASEVEIPFQIFDALLGFGTGERFTVGYSATARFRTSGPTELAVLEYRDPLSLIFQPPEVLTPQPQPVPGLPASAALLTGLAGLVALRRSKLSKGDKS